MPPLRRFDHVGITVDDLQAVTAFFLELGLEQDGPSQIVEGEFLDTVIGIPDARTEIVMLRVPGGSTSLELSTFHQPVVERGPQPAPATQLGLRNVCFEVDDLRATVDRLGADGFGLVGGIGQYEDIWLMCYVRGPEGIIVSLAERLA